jgi:hypothetical protein
MALAAMAIATPVSANDSNNPANPAAALEGTYTFRLTPATSFSVLNPTLSGLATAPRQDILRVGVLVFDGAGKVMGRVVATTDDNAGATLVKSFRITGTYTIDADGFGTLSISPVSPAAPGEDITDEGAETYAFKLNERARMLHLIQTDNDGGGAKIFLTGDAFQDRDLSDFGKGDDDDDDDEDCDNDDQGNGKDKDKDKDKNKHKNKHKKKNKH